MVCVVLSEISIASVAMLGVNITILMLGECVCVCVCVCVLVNCMVLSVATLKTKLICMAGL